MLASELPMLLIATDEAGYGPKLGPLIIAATAWRLPVGAAPEEAFAPLRQPGKLRDVDLVIDDSKSIYKPGGGLQGLHAAVSASHHWCGRTERSLPEILPHLIDEDVESVSQVDWLNELSADQFWDPAETAPLRQAWSQSGIRQLQTRARVITAARFNEICSRGANKAQLLSESTVELVRSLLPLAESDDVQVFCDRHGGRRYYAGVLQHGFPEAIVQVVSESNRQSVYRVQLPPRWKVESLTIHFTVKGDSFTPVAYSSIHAKYLRERWMESFNRYFHRLYPKDRPWRPTAGYPVDADRFLEQIADVIKQHGIATQHLVRQR
ncbi:MAG: hypothetical protein MI861_24860 [Pirellulales bacterium]|nr:hypothetical protein [Pirellulales bacterium]